MYYIEYFTESEKQVVIWVQNGLSVSVVCPYYQMADRELCHISLAQKKIKIQKLKYGFY